MSATSGMGNAYDRVRIEILDRCGGKEVRFLTFEEAEPIILEQCPSRATRIDEKTGRPLIVDSKIVVDTFAEPSFNTKRLGLYDVGQNPPVPLRPTDEDFAAEWSTESPVVEPEVVAPEAVDEVLSETAESPVVDQ